MRVKKAVGIFVIVFVIGLLVSDSGATEKLDLKLRLKPGQKYGMRLITELRKSQTIKGKQEHESFMFARGMGFEVKEVDANDVASVEVTYRTLQMKVIRGGHLYEYDSTKQSMADDYRKIPVILAAGVGESFIMKVTSKGKIIRLTGIEKMRERIVEKINAWDEKYLKIKIEGWKEMRRHNTKSRYSEKRIKNMLSDMIVAFPDRPLAIGDSWTDKLKIWTKSYEIDGTYTLKDAEKGTVTLDLRAKRTPEEKPFSWVNNEGRKVGFKIVGSCKGSLEIDEQSGWLMRSKINMQFTGEVIDKTGDTQISGPILKEEVITVEPMKIE